MNQIKKERNVNIDLIRSVAVFMVICVHFFMNVNYYGEIFIGKRMYIFTCMRTISMICVPLFLLITGYLMNKHKISQNYYKGIIKILEIYFIASILCILFKKYYLNIEINFKSAILSILDFSGAPYSWYIEMYLGLFLLIPFLNLIWNNLEIKNHKILLIITLIFLTVLPSIFNIYDWNTPGFFLNPTLSSTYQSIFPKWWINIYPITYYFIGAYIKEYDIKISLIKNIFLIIICILIFSTFNFFRNYNTTFDYGIYTSWYSFENIVDSVLIFIFLLHVNMKKIGKNIKKIIIKIAEYSLGTYLLSYIFDQLFYPKLLSYTGSVHDTLEYFIPIVLSIFILSTFLSFLSYYLINLRVFFTKVIIKTYKNFTNFQ